MANQIFATAHECASEIGKLRAQGVACRLEKVEGGFTVVLMNGKAQQNKVEVVPKKTHVEVKPQRESFNVQDTMEGKAQPQNKVEVVTPKEEVEVKTRKSSFKLDEVMQDIHGEVKALLEENEGLHEEDQIKVLDFDIAYRHVKRSSLWKLFVPIDKAEVMLTYINTHAIVEDPHFPSAEVDVYEKGPINDLFVSLAVVILIEDGDIPDALHRKLIEKFS